MMRVQFTVTQYKVNINTISSFENTISNTLTPYPVHCHSMTTRLWWCRGSNCTWWWWWVIHLLFFSFFVFSFFEDYLLFSMAVSSLLSILPILLLRFIRPCGLQFFILRFILFSSLPSPYTILRSFSSILHTDSTTARWSNIVLILQQCSLYLHFSVVIQHHCVIVMENSCLFRKINFVYFFLPGME